MSPAAPHDATPSFVVADAAEVLTAVMRNSADGMILVDLDGRILKWNSAAEEIYGWSQHDVLGDCVPFVREANRRRVLSDLRTIASSGCVADTQLPCERADGSAVTSHVAVIPIADGDGDAAGVILVVRETADDERFERHRSDFAALVLRHLNGPLRALVGQVSLLSRRELWSDENRRARIVSSAIESAELAARVADRLALLSEYERPRSIGSLQPVDVSDLLGDIVADMPAGRMLAELDLTGEPVMADPRALSAALRALLDRSTGPLESGQPACITVRSDETGLRIDMMDPFWPAANDIGRHERPEYAEAAIALSIAEGVFAAHGGSVTVVRAGQGATISMRLPSSTAKTEGETR